MISRWRITALVAIAAALTLSCSSSSYGPTGSDNDDNGSDSITYEVLVDAPRDGQVYPLGAQVPCDWSVETRPRRVNIYGEWWFITAQSDSVRLFCSNTINGGVGTQDVLVYWFADNVAFTSDKPATLEVLLKVRTETGHADKIGLLVAQKSLFLGFR